MTSRHRKEQQKFNLQTPPISLNGQAQPLAAGQVAGAGKQGSEGSAGQAEVGKIEVSPRAISHIASRAAQSCYGVVGLASRHARPGLAELLRREEEYKGVVVTFSGDRVVIDLYVVIEYGTRISEVARNIMSSVKFAAESALGVPVVQVNVNVQGIRVSS
ncbi:MAG TPA: Asp23/Gls24 family envelope stress response protein [Chloroflexia bacterium]|nr:Asp23/Gls24 family envelope stress response protein [Chloroflexia bacterium]